MSRILFLISLVGLSPIAVIAGDNFGGQPARRRLDQRRRRTCDQFQLARLSRKVL